MDRVAAVVGAEPLLDPGADHPRLLLEAVRGPAEKQRSHVVTHEVWVRNGPGRGGQDLEER